VVMMVVMVVVLVVVMVVMVARRGAPGGSQRDLPASPLTVRRSEVDIISSTLSSWAFPELLASTIQDVFVAVDGYPFERPNAFVTLELRGRMGEDATSRANLLV
jgi:hypothetical protein